MIYNDRLREASAWVAAHPGETITVSTNPTTSRFTLRSTVPGRYTLTLPTPEQRAAMRAAIADAKTHRKDQR